MSVQWADDYSRYGLGAASNARMSDGLPYNNWPASGAQCEADPDPSVLGGVCLAWGDDTPILTGRIALPTPVSGTAGFLSRYWFTGFGRAGGDANSLQSLVTFSSLIASVVTPLITLYVEPNGALSLCEGLTGALIETTGSPVITTNSWNHIEAAYDGTTGEVEARLNGVPLLTGVAATTGVIYFANPGRKRSPLATSGDLFYIKDTIIRDDQGTTNNNFMGTVICRRFLPNADVTLGGWVPSAGASGYDLLADNAPANIFTVTGQLTPDAANNIRINNTYYRPTAGSVDAGAPAGTSANPWLVAMGVDAATSLANLFNAINATGVAGTTYSTALTAHPNVSGKGVSATQFIITSNDGVTTAYTCTETMANASWASGTMSLVGPQDLSYLSADDTPPAPMQFALQNLPPDVTSVRAIIPVVRARKIDGGDGNVQTSLISNGDFANGVDRPITTAFTYYFDVNELSPDTGNPWTPVEFDAATGQISRTL